MQRIEVEFLKHHAPWEVKLPVHSTEWAAGWDFFASDITAIIDGKVNVPDPSITGRANGNTVLYSRQHRFIKYIEYDTGITVAIPHGHVGLIGPRSSVAEKNMTLSNGLGWVDSDYRGTVKARFRPTLPFEAHPHLYDELIAATKADNEGDRRRGLSDTLRKYECYDLGEKFLQMCVMPYPLAEYVQKLVLGHTARGTGGFGSTGNT